MAAQPSSNESGQDAVRVKAFFDQWAIYRKVLEHDYLCHRGAYAAVGGALAELERPFSFLDLGAGDAQGSLAALAGRPVSRYVAVDLSEVALRLAEENAAALPAEKRFVAGDFVEFVRGSRETFDVVFIGLSFHHLPLAHKRSFAPELRRLVAPGGRLLIYEPIRRPGESRDAMLTRWWGTVRTTWTALTPDELEQSRDHVFTHDYAEETAAYRGLLEDAGFGAARVRFVDPDEFYAVIEARG